jgi:hypothetical protein
MAEAERRWTPVAGPGRMTDGLQLGQDARGAVGEYTAPFSYGGQIGRVVLELK